MYFVINYTLKDVIKIILVKKYLVLSQQFPTLFMPMTNH